MKSVGPSGDENSGHPEKDARIGYAGAPHLKEFEPPPRSLSRSTLRTRTRSQPTLRFQRRFCISAD